MSIGKHAHHAAMLVFMAALSSANAGILKIDESAFTPAAGRITFSELPYGTVNPTYTPADYGGGAGAPTVRFGGYFDGQALGDPSSCPPGAAVTGCVLGDPNDPLRLDPRAPVTSIVNDGANPTSPVLSGSPIFNGPIAVLFDIDVAGVGLEGGYFDALGGTAITAYDRNGNFLGSVVNEMLGIEFLGLVTDDGSERIAGLLFSLVDSEPAGFAIDNLRFGLQGQVTAPTVSVPEGSTAAFLLLALAALRARHAQRRPASSRKG